MTIKLGLEMTTGPLPYSLLTKRIEHEIMEQLRPLARKHTADRNEIVSDWSSEHRPLFKDFVYVENNVIIIDIDITNANRKIGKYSSATIEDLWRWWEETGTKPHTIVPVRAMALRFKVGSIVVYTKRVNHPGTRPQERTVKGDQQILSAIEPLIEQGIQDGLRHKKSTVKK